MSQAPIGILLLSLGSPNHLDEMEAYLLDIRHGRAPSPEFVDEIKARYRAAGGRSPLLDITNRQAKALQERLDPSGAMLKVYVGMRHWHPYVRAVMQQMANDGIKEMVSLPLTPYQSTLSIGAYHETVKQANADLELGMKISYAASWHDHPVLIESFADLVEETLVRIINTGASEPRVLFTAHSLPERILKENDPYPNQLLQTASLVAKQVGLSVWSFAYQSQGGSNEPWLGPKVEEMLDRFQARAVKEVLIAPIGFVSDHMEILYDVDILFKDLAARKGIKLERTPSLNDSPKFIQALEDIVRQNIKTLSATPVKVEA